MPEDPQARSAFLRGGGVSDRISNLFLAIRNEIRLRSGPVLPLFSDLDLIDISVPGFPVNELRYVISATVYLPMSAADVYSQDERVPRLTLNVIRGTWIRFAAVFTSFSIPQRNRMWDMALGLLTTDTDDLNVMAARTTLSTMFEVVDIQMPGLPDRFLPWLSRYEAGAQYYLITLRTTIDPRDSRPAPNPSANGSSSENEYEDDETDYSEFDEDSDPDDDEPVPAAPAPSEASAAAINNSPEPEVEEYDYERCTPDPPLDYIRFYRGAPLDYSG